MRILYLYITNPNSIGVEKKEYAKLKTLNELGIDARGLFFKNDIEKETYDKKLNIRYIPTVMIRNSILKNNNLQYEVDYQYAEDYMLWVKISAYAKLANLQDTILTYRIHESSITARKTKTVKSQANKVQKYQFEQLIGREFSITEKQVFNFIIDNKKTNINIPDFVKFLNTIEKANIKTGKYSHNKLSNIIKNWANLPLIRNNRFNIKLLYHYLFGKLKKYSSFNIKGIIKYSLLR